MILISPATLAASTRQAASGADTTSLHRPPPSKTPVKSLPPNAATPSPRLITRTLCERGNNEAKPASVLPIDLKLVATEGRLRCRSSAEGDGVGDDSDGGGEGEGVGDDGNDDVTADEERDPGFSAEGEGEPDEDLDKPETSGAGEGRLDFSPRPSQQRPQHAHARRTKYCKEARGRSKPR